MSEFRVPVQPGVLPLCSGHAGLIIHLTEQPSEADATLPTRRQRPKVTRMEDGRLRIPTQILAAGPKLLCAFLIFASALSQMAQ